MSESYYEEHYPDGGPEPMDWMEAVRPVDKRRDGFYFDRKAVAHTTTVKRKGKDKGGRGKVARLK